MQLHMHSVLLQSASMQSLAYWCWMNYYFMQWPQMAPPHLPMPSAPPPPHESRTSCSVGRPADDGDSLSDRDSPSPRPCKAPLPPNAWSAEEVLQTVGRAAAGMPRAPKEMLVYQEDLEEELMTKFFDPRGPSKPGKGHKLAVCPYKLDCRHQHCRKAHMTTEITCYFWERGNCFKKTSCPYLHGYVRS